MNSTTKVLIRDKEWLIKEDKEKIGSIAKSKKGYVFLRQGKKMTFQSLAEIKAKFGIALFEDSIKKSLNTDTEENDYNIYDFPCSSKPYSPVYSIKKKLPLYAKSAKSKSQYCAGYYVIKFKKGWVKSFCPKLITLERYAYHGPFKTDIEMKTVLNTVNKT